MALQPIKKIDSFAYCKITLILQLLPKYEETNQKKLIADDANFI